MVKIDIRDFTLIREAKAPVLCKRPCSLYSVMLGNGEISDIYSGDNIARLGDITLSECSFLAEIPTDARIVNAKSVYLKLSGIYADAEIFFNGRSYGRVHNSNRTYLFDVADAVHEGVSLLEIKCKKPLKGKNLLDSCGNRQSGYELAPFVADMGIMGVCEILSTNSEIIDKISVLQRHGGGKVTVDISIDTLGAGEDVRAVATLTSPTGKIYVGGLSSYKGSIIVNDPQLWWPRGLGSPSLYKLTVSLYSGEVLEDMREMNIGLREITLKTDGESEPLMYINGCRFMPLGATYVREDSIIPEINEKRAERFVSSAADANMNTLRILGEGLYPEEYLYDLCDRYGIMVWQDISVRYSKPPIAVEFAAGINDELCDIISRVSRHPSVSLLYLVFYSREGDVVPTSEAEAYEFRDSAYIIAEPIARRYAEGLPFIKNPKSLEDTDESSLESEIRLIHDACFASLPALATVRTFAGEGEQNPLSRVMELHAKCPDAIIKMLVNTASHYRYPYDFRSFIYATQIASGYSVLRSVTRARLTDSHTSGAVCRQLNDSWPSVSSASVDYFGRRKALHYYEKRAFESVFASAVTDGARAYFGISNETPKKISAVFVFALYDKTDKCHFEKKVEVSAEAFSRAAIDEMDFSHIIGGALSDYYLVCELKREGVGNYRTVVLFTPPKSLDLRKPDIRVKIEGSGRDYEMLLTSDALALATEVSFDGIDFDASDNYLDLNPDYYAKISIKTARTTNRDELIEKLRITSVYDIGNVEKCQ